MTRFLLDEHFSPEVIRIATNIDKGILIHAVATYQDGTLRGQSDAEILSHCQTNNLVLVTADLQTIPPLLKEWADQGSAHAGVVFVSHKSIRSNDHVRLAHGIVELAGLIYDLSNTVIFIR